MLKIFNHCMDNGFYPWHTSIITPIFKAGDPYNPDNYRAIAVGSCLGKLFSSILLQRLKYFKQQHCSDPIEQLGFKKGAQTNDHVLTLKTLIDKYTKRQRTNLFTCFVDLKKAFDTVSRDLLLYKLVKLNIRGQFFTVIEDMYNHSLSKIKIENLLSGNIKMERGTEQGHPLSPDLFKLFIKDLSDLFYTIGDYPYLDDFLVTHLLWADDLVLLALDCESLQVNIDILHNFCKKWGLSINIKKTKTLVFGRSTASLITACYLGEDLIENVDSYCYLGIVFHKSGNFKIATNELRKKSLRALFGLKRNIVKNALSIKSLFILFDSLIKPVFLYGCQVLVPHNDLTKYLTKDICKDSTGEAFLSRVARDPYEKFHLRYLKWCLSVHHKASNVGCWGETGRYPLYTHAIKMSIDYFVRVKHCETNSLLHAAFVEQQKLKLDWYCNTSSIIELLGSGPSKHPSINARINTQALFREKWVDAKNSSPKLDFYKNLKGDYGEVDYLTNIKNHKHRSALTRLRISAHNLFIERGRYAKPPISREDRICIYCKHNYQNNVVESEMHVLDACTLYCGIRTTICNAANCAKVSDLFVNSGNDVQYDVKAGKAAYSIIEKHKAFTSYFESWPENYLTSTGKFIFL